jgi:hypothetical protein
MAGSTERPFDPGEAPITHGQYETMCRVVAELCFRKKIPVSPTTVLNHGEVERNLGIKQRNKWDVMVLPWALSMTWEQVGEHFRSRVSYYLSGYEHMKNSDGERLVPSVEETLFDSAEGFPVLRAGRVVAARGLNIRSLPDAKASKIAPALPLNTIVYIKATDESASQGPWYFVEADRGERSPVSGWVYGKYVDLDSPWVVEHDGAVG